MARGKKNKKNNDPNIPGAAPPTTNIPGLAAAPSVSNNDGAQRQVGSQQQQRAGGGGARPQEQQQAGGARPKQQQKPATTPATQNIPGLPVTEVKSDVAPAKKKSQQQTPASKASTPNIPGMPQEAKQQSAGGAKPKQQAQKNKDKKPMDIQPPAAASKVPNVVAPVAGGQQPHRPQQQQSKGPKHMPRQQQSVDSGSQGRGSSGASGQGSTGISQATSGMSNIRIEDFCLGEVPPKKRLLQQDQKQPDFPGTLGKNCRLKTNHFGIGMRAPTGMVYQYSLEIVPPWERPYRKSDSVTYHKVIHGWRKICLHDLMKTDPYCWVFDGNTTLYSTKNFGSSIPNCTVSINEDGKEKEFHVNNVKVDCQINITEDLLNWATKGQSGIFWKIVLYFIVKIKW